MKIVSLGNNIVHAHIVVALVTILLLFERCTANMVKFHKKHHPLNSVMVGTEYWSGKVVSKIGCASLCRQPVR